MHEIPVFRGEAGKKDPNAHAEKGHLKGQKRKKEESRPFRIDLPTKSIEHQQSQNEQKLNAKFKDTDQHVGDWDGQSGKIHLAEQRRITEERSGIR